MIRKWVVSNQGAFFLQAERPCYVKYLFVHFQHVKSYSPTIY